MPEAQSTSVPRCIGIIMDGNRRWARERGLPTFEGHAEGRKRLEDFLHWANEAGIEKVIAYTFSTENWNRTKEEVSYVMDLLRDGLDSIVDSAKKAGARVRAIGELHMLPEDILTRVLELPEQTKDFGEKELVLALSYGGHSEILSTVKKLAQEHTPEEIEAMTVEDFSHELYTGDMPHPDLIIRTGGERRLSNFLPWQSVYSEIFFVDTHWPAFSKEEFHDILNAYASIERRHGQ